MEQNLCNPAKFMYHLKNPTNKVSHPGIKVIKKGIVWVGCPDASCKKMIAIKKCKEHEIDTQDAMHKEFPDLVPEVYNKVKCFDGVYMYNEFIKDGSFKHYTGKLAYRIVLRTLKALKRIHAKFPSFRHNDLHVDNVLIKNNEPLLYDFELANFHGNPVFDDRLKHEYGIFPGNNALYDAHFFINSVCAEPRFKKEFTPIALSVFPPEYIGDNSPVLKNWRLKFGVKHTKLPSIDAIITAFTPKKGMEFASTERKFTRVTRSPPKPRIVVKFNAKNKNKVAIHKAILMREGLNEIRAEIEAIKRVERMKPIHEHILLRRKKSPSPARVVPRVSPARVPAAQVRAPAKNNAGPSQPMPVVTFVGSRPRINNKFADGYKKDDLIRLLRRLGYRVMPTSTIAQLCSVLKAQPARASPVRVPRASPVQVRAPVQARNFVVNLKKILTNANLETITKGQVKAKLRELGHTEINPDMIKNMYLRVKYLRLKKDDLKKFVTGEGVRVLSRNTKQNMINKYIKTLYVKSV